MKAQLMIQASFLTRISLDADEAIIEELIAVGGDGVIPHKRPGPNFSEDHKLVIPVLMKRLLEALAKGDSQPFTIPTYKLISYEFHNSSDPV
ncbi:MAG: hypothetical protein MRZ79_04805 [Bacteroidia bacterium]|nr:hypothetical protein [Bacteroidia bacterium]